MSTQSAVPDAFEATPTPGQPVRSEALLSADQSDPDLQIAEEVAFDLQSDQAHHIGAMPDDTPVSKPADAMAQSLRAESGADADKRDDGAVPPAP